MRIDITAVGIPRTPRGAPQSLFCYNITMSKKIIFIGITSLLLLAVPVIFYLMGYAYIGLKDPKQKVVVSYEVCGQDIIAKYNDIVQNQNTGDDAFIGKLASLAQEIESKPNYTKDPTCVYMAYSYYELKGDSGKVKELYDLSQGHIRDGRFINNNVSGAAQMALPDVNDGKDDGAGAVG